MNDILDVGNPSSSVDHRLSRVSKSSIIHLKLTFLTTKVDVKNHVKDPALSKLSMGTTYRQLAHSVLRAPMLAQCGQELSQQGSIPNDFGMFHPFS